MGYRDLTDLQRPFKYAASSSSDFGMLTGVKDFAKKIKMKGARMDLRNRWFRPTDNTSCDSFRGTIKRVLYEGSVGYLLCGFGGNLHLC